MSTTNSSINPDNSNINNSKGNKNMSHLNKLMTSAKEKLAMQLMLASKKTRPNKLDAKLNMQIQQMFEKGSKKLGTAANEDILNSCYMISDAKTKKEMLNLVKKFPYFLSDIVDSSLQGEDTPESRLSESNLTQIMEHMILAGKPLPATMRYRVPFAMRDVAIFTDNHQVQEIVELARELVDDMDKHVMGEGSDNNQDGDRRRGLIDTINVDFSLFMADIPNYLLKIARSIRTTYNNSIRKLMIDTKDMPLEERVTERKNAKLYQLEVLKSLTIYNYQERKSIVCQWAADIYQASSVHDSILFIDSMDDNGIIAEGVFNIFIEILCDVGVAKRVKTYDEDTTVIRQLFGQPTIEKSIDIQDPDKAQFRLALRAWRSKVDGGITVAMLEGIDSITIRDKKAVAEIMVECEGKVEIKEIVLNINTDHSDRLTEGCTYGVSEMHALTSKDGKEIATGVRFLLNPASFPVKEVI